MNELKNAAFKLADAELMFEYPSLPVAVFCGGRDVADAGEPGGDGESNDIIESTHSIQRVSQIVFG